MVDQFIPDIVSVTILLKFRDSISGYLQLTAMEQTVSKCRALMQFVTEVIRFITVDAGWAQISLQECSFVWYR